MTTQSVLRLYGSIQQTTREHRAADRSHRCARRAAVLALRWTSDDTRRRTALDRACRSRGLWLLPAHADRVDLYRHAVGGCLLYTSPSPRDGLLSRMPSS